MGNDFKKELGSFLGDTQKEAKPSSLKEFMIKATPSYQGSLEKTLKKVGVIEERIGRMHQLLLEAFDTGRGLFKVVQLDDTPVAREVMQGLTRVMHQLSNVIDGGDDKGGTKGLQREVQMHKARINAKCKQIERERFAYVSK